MFGNTSQFADIGGVQTRISSDDDLSLDVLFSGFFLHAVQDGAVNLSFLKNAVLVDDSDDSG